VEIVALRPAGPARAFTEDPGTVLRAYFDARRARALRQFLCSAVPVLTVLLVAVQAAVGLLARGALLAQTALSVCVAAAAVLAEWRAARKLRALIQSSCPPEQR
jgi:hypothetical protein